MRWTAVIPRRAGQGAVEDLDGITVYGFPRWAPWLAARLYRACDAHIYHSQEPSWGTWLAMQAAPGKRHLVTFRDPRTAADWKIEQDLPSPSRAQVMLNRLYEDSALVRRAIRRADGVFCAAKHLIPKVMQKYGLASEPAFLPTPVPVPPRVCKGGRPAVCFLARWDRRKRPELFFELARQFAEVQFIAVGRSRDPAYDHALRDEYGDLPNLEMTGFLDQFASDQLSRILERSWVMVNTAAREGLPNSFIEAAAHGCAILSAVDPDEFASRFGRQVRNDDFATGLAALLKDGEWRRRGCAGREYVRQTFELERAVDQHLEVYASG